MKNKTGPLSLRSAFYLLAAILLSVNGAWAKPTTPGQAQSVVQHWLGREAIPMGCPLGREIKGVQTFNDDTGAPAYYVVYLKPGGLVFLPADDLVEPVIGFVSGATSFDPSPKNPLGALVSRDIPNRVLQARRLTAQKTAGGSAPAAGNGLPQSQQKWTWLLDGAPVTDTYAGNISDVRVAPLVRSTWDQGGADGSYPDYSTSPPTPCNSPCYNYYTPPGSNGSGLNYVDGCGATAMAQLMRYWTYPTAGVGVQSYTITVDGNNVTRYLRGGNGSGGSYNWGTNGSNMPLNPSSGATTTQCAAIGALCADVGASVNMSYTSSESSAWGEYAAWALVHAFKYGNAIAGSNQNTTINRPALNNMLNPNLDAGCPTLLTIWSSSAGGHTIVCDGYGYNSTSFYNHLNMGWSGEDDAWYNLPTVDTNNGPFPNGNFNTVVCAIYNIYPSGSGEIISGRVTSSGAALSNVTITATGPGGPYTTTTNGNGIYALAKLPSNSTFTINASKIGYSFTSQSVTTGKSISSIMATPVGDGSDINLALCCGNQWGVNFDAYPPPVTLNQSLDNSRLAFPSGGDNLWFGQTGTSYYGGSAAQSGPIDPGQYSWLQTSVKGPGTLTFWFKVSSYYDSTNNLYDPLQLYLDGTGVHWWAGNWNWTQYTLQVPAGGHTINWSYWRSASSPGSGSNCVWLDKVTFSRSGVGAALPILLLGN